MGAGPTSWSKYTTLILAEEELEIGPKKYEQCFVNLQTIKTECNYCFLTIIWVWPSFHKNDNSESSDTVNFIPKCRNADIYTTNPTNPPSEAARGCRGHR